MTRKRAEAGGEAVGAYLRRLREHADISTTEAAASLGTTATQIWRLEAWQSDVRSTILFAYIRLLRGSAEDVALLMANSNATEHDGFSLADQRIRLRG